MNVQFYFAKLGFDRIVTFKEVKHSYKVLVKMWHPDQFSHDPTLQARAEEKLKEINKAYAEVKAFFALQESSRSLLASGMQTSSLIFAACTDIACKMGTSLFALLHKYTLHTDDSVGTKKNEAAAHVFRASSQNDTHGRQHVSSAGKDFQQVLEDVMREKASSQDSRSS